MMAPTRRVVTANRVVISTEWRHATEVAISGQSISDRHAGFLQLLAPMRRRLTLFLAIAIGFSAAAFAQAPAGAIPGGPAGGRGGFAPVVIGPPAPVPPDVAIPRGARSIDHRNVAVGEKVLKLVRVGRLTLGSIWRVSRVDGRSLLGRRP